MRVASILIAISMATSAFAADRALDAKMVGCTTLKACVKIIDANLVDRDDGRIYGDEADVAGELIRFGEPAKKEVLRRAVGEHAGWRNLAGDVLALWPELVDEDVPQLVEALRRNPGGGVARALGRVGSGEAIQALLADVRVHGSQNQSGFALRKLGPRVLPYVLRELSGPKPQPFEGIVSEMGAVGASVAPAWAGTAADGRRSKSERLGALRGLRAMGVHARPVAANLHALLTDADVQIQQAAFDALRAMDDPIVLQRLVAQCQPSGDLDCLGQIASFGQRAKGFGADIAARFLASPIGAARSAAVSTLGFIGYAAANDRLVDLLEDSDWRVVYAATRSLNWLQAKDSVRPLRRVGKSHWLPQVRDLANSNASSLEAGRNIAPPTASFDNFEIDARLVPDAAPCKSNRWDWNGKTFSLPPSQVAQYEVRSEASKSKGGRFVGLDKGEWGGSLKWVPDSGSEETLFEHNVLGLAASRSGVVIASGDVGLYRAYSARPSANDDSFAICNCPSGYGYALHAARNRSGAWQVSEVARLPRAPDALIEIGRERYAALSGGRVVVFSLKKIEGLATCVP